MKAKTKAQRRGRPRKIGPREDNGRPQRPTVAEIKSGNVVARMIQHGLTLVQSGDRLAGYEVGRLYLRGQIDLVDVEVCDDYVQAVAAYMTIVCPTQPFPKAMNYVSAGGGSADPEDHKISAIRSRYDVPYKFLTDAKNGVRDHLMAFHDVAFYDNPAAHRLPNIIAVLDALRKLNRRPTRKVPEEKK